MRNIFVAGLLVALVCATAGQAVDFTRIRTVEAFRALLADRPLTDARGERIVFTAEGGIGTGGDLAPAGGWTWRDEALCRRGPEADCRAVHVRGATVVLRGGPDAIGQSFTLG